jgi:hypothetical protein
MIARADHRAHEARAVADNGAPCRRRLGLPDRDLLLFLLRFRRLRQDHGEHAILESRGNLVGIDVVGNLERALERAEAPLR